MQLTDIDAELANWNDLQPTSPSWGLLLGNGASLAVWKNFAYDSLFDLSQTTRNNPMSRTELAVFSAMETSNFEPVLAALKSAMRVNAALTISSSSPRNRYFAIKEALIHAIRSVHIPWKLIEAKTLAHLNNALQQYSSVYSSNYDLLAYWAVMHAPEHFDDLFNDEATFNLHAAQAKATRVLYLHGGMHLVKNLDGTVRKLLSSESTLLGSFAINALDDVPLFVCEGTSAEKMKMIRTSDYLSFCHGQLAQHSDALCIFGHTLGKQDAHILAAIHQAKPQRIAISVLPRSAAFVEFQKRHYLELFSDMQTQLSFFDAKSHPLGSPDLLVAAKPSL
ncbi:MAG TPA: DUF4917 family protein [Pseudomonas sp.]|uniref:DUF4917 family protein n=1 Tax=Pseudomonas sp. TaxID=306 RepID=UPI002EDB680D